MKDIFDFETYGNCCFCAFGGFLVWGEQSWPFIQK